MIHTGCSQFPKALALPLEEEAQGHRQRRLLPLLVSIHGREGGRRQREKLMNFRWRRGGQEQRVCLHAAHFYAYASYWASPNLKHIFLANPVPKNGEIVMLLGSTISP